MEQVRVKTESTGLRRKRNRTSFRQYGLAKPYVHRRKFATADQWRAFARTEKCPKDLPIHPDLVYDGRGWKGWDDWLGRKPFTYEEAKEIVQKMDVLNGQVWKETAGRMFPRPNRMPLRPDQFYKKEFEGWQVFLGHEKVKSRHPGPTNPHVFQKTGVYRPFEEALKFVSKLNLGSYDGYLKWRGTYQGTDLPWHPDEIYKDEWLGWSAFLGNKVLPGLLMDTSVLYVARRPTDPFNVYQIHVESMGKSHLEYRAEREGFKVVKVWKYDPALRAEVQRVIEMNARSYGSDRDFIVENIYGLFQDLFNYLQLV